LFNLKDMVFADWILKNRYVLFIVVD